MTAHPTPVSDHRSEGEHTPIDWSAPLELFDGTPVRVSQEMGPQPDSDGHYRVVREDGRWFDHEEEWACGMTRVFADADGRWWLADDHDEPIIRNRAAIARATHGDGK